MKLGHIDYLNCYPFYYHAFEKRPLRAIEIVSDYPSALNKMMSHGDLDMSPISAATYSDISRDALVLPDFCLSSIGYVGSVILLSKVPIEDLDRKIIGLTSASHTSVVLLKVLLNHYYHLTPTYVPSSPRPVLKDMDAALVIGNDAMVRPTNPTAYNYDLGDVWFRKTGFPVVFAVFAVREQIIEKYQDRIKTVMTSYRASLDCLRTEKGTLIQKARKRYPDILYDIDTYYDQLKFEFSEEMKKALMFYYSVASEMGLLQKVDQLKYLTF